MIHTLDELQALAEAATPGPWETYGERVSNENGDLDFYVWRKADANFICAAHADMLELIAIARRYEELALRTIELGCHCFDSDYDGGEPDESKLCAPCLALKYTTDRERGDG